VRRGDYPPHLPPTPSSPRCGRGGGDERSRGDLANQITPLPQCGRGAGGEGYPRTLPLPLEAYPKYPVVEADRLRYSGAAPVHQDTLVGIWCHLVPSGNFCGIR